MEPTLLGVPKIIYESVEDILEAQIRRLAIDIAKTLGVNEKLLLSELKKDKVKTYLFDDGIEIDNLRCKAYNQQKHVYIPCEQPIVYKKEYCTEHLLEHVVKEDIKGANVLNLLIIDDTKYYIDSKQKVYNLDFEIIGLYKSETKEIYQFTIE